MNKHLNEYLKRKNNDLHFPQNHRLLKLYKWLNIEIPISALFVFSFFFGAIAIVGTIALAGFALYIIRILYLEGKKGWIITLIIFLLLPVLALKMLEYVIPSAMLFYLPVLIASFLIYSILLKVSLPSMMDD